MGDFKIKLSLIIDILKEKNTKLKTLAIITENQGTILESKEKSKESVEMLTQLIEEKQRLIDEVLGYDDVFLKKYEEIKGEFDKEEVRRNNKEAILEMQELIVSINENNDKVIALERANDEIVKSLKVNIEQATKEKETKPQSIPKAAQAPMTEEFKQSEKTILSGGKHHSKVTNKPIATVNVKAELEKSSATRNNLMSEKQETGKKYKIKSVIEQYKNNRR